MAGLCVILRRMAVGGDIAWVQLNFLWMHGLGFLIAYLAILLSNRMQKRMFEDLTVALFLRGVKAVRDVAMNVWTSSSQNGASGRE
ncbi:hypothetical protein GTK09_23935 [Jiella sp. 40Bstr34]|uniref:Uncharacterized protein n=2 Tax=Jiella pacifica TaxID=2696469 RepID=A0A6N9T8B9_9HYPH|nr:hypothetical protein [Jiella pacifica]